MTDGKYKMELALLTHDIHHELALGIHTYHNCKCGRGATRRGTCSRCLVDEFIERTIERKGKVGG